MWLVKGFEARPARIIIYHNGPRTELRPGQEGFDEMATAIHDCLTEGLVRPSGIGFSDASLLDAYARFVSVEVFFDRPVKLHAWFDTSTASWAKRRDAAGRSSCSKRLASRRQRSAWARTPMS
jgi:hypothetical protein